MSGLTDADVAVAAAAAGADEVRRAYGGPLTRLAKEGTDFATSADLASEAAIRALLAEHRPGDAMVGEEGGRTGPAGARRSWLVDPLCGTRNFAATTPLVAVNVALQDGDRAPAAASADPFSGEVFWSDGEAAYVRRDGTDAPAAPSGRSLLVDMAVEDLDSDITLRLAASLTFREAFSARVSSTTLALSWVADGRRAAYVHEGDLRDNVHFAAPLAVVRAAGCVVTGIAGQPLHTGPGGLLAAADPDTHENLLALLRPHLP